jgi:hypothetical protein
MIKKWLKIYPVVAISTLALSGCAFLGGAEKPISIMAAPVERLPLALAPPSPIKFAPLEWRVVTPENIDRVWEQLRAQKQDLVLFALTDTGYQQLSLDFAEIRAFISNQKFIILKYQEYYEPKKEK